MKLILFLLGFVLLLLSQSEAYSQIQVLQGIQCDGDSTAALIAVPPDSLVAPFEFLWNTGDTSQAIYTLGAGIYDLMIVDSGNDTIRDTISILAPPPIVITLDSMRISDCDGHNNGGVYISVSGGTPNYNYLWTETQFDSTYTTQDLDTVRGGIYEIVVTDSLGCMAVDTFTINNIDTITYTWSYDDYICNGLQSAVTFQADSADTSYYFTYSWNSVFNSDTVLTNDTVYDYTTNFLAGTYTITITDNTTGCAAYFDVGITETQAPLVVHPYVIHNTCFEDANGSISLNVTGGDPQPDYIYTWRNSAGIMASTGSSITGLPIGWYEYTVTENECTVDGLVYIEPMTPVQGFLISQNLNCNGDNTGEATAIYSGGTGPLAYSWSTGSTAEQITGLSSGTYYVTITDSLNCFKIDSAVIAEPAIVDLQLNTSSNITCFGADDGIILLQSSGGTGPYEYEWWYAGANLGFPDTAFNLPAGDYSIIMRDSVGCSDTVNITLLQPQETIMLDSIVRVSCNNGSDGFWGMTPNGLYHPYVAYALDAQLNVLDSISTDTVTQLYFNGLTPGTYYYLIVDNLGCTYLFEHFFFMPLPIVVDLADIQHVNCFNDSTGSIALTSIHGGDLPYTYLWSDGSSTNAINNLPANVYNVTVTDALGCGVEETFTITQPDDSIRFYPTLTDPACLVSNDGSIELPTYDVWGSPAPTMMYVYDSLGLIVDSTSVSGIVTGLGQGPYTVTLSNTLGCTATRTVTLNGGDECFQIPNLVTPNGDGFNDVFWIEEMCTQNFDAILVQIYDSWGKMVYESTDCAFSWNPLDSDAPPNSVYYYLIRLTSNGQDLLLKSSIDVKY